MFRSNFVSHLLTHAKRSFSTQRLEKPLSTAFGNPKMPDKLYKTVELEMKSAEKAVLESYERFLIMTANYLNINIGKKWVIDKPTRQRWTLLKSIFVHRKHLVQYEVRTYYRWIQFHKMTGSTADTFLEYVERMLPEGVALKVTRISVEPLPEHLTQEEVKKAFGDNMNTLNDTDSENSSSSDSDGETEQTVDKKSDSSH